MQGADVTEGWSVDQLWPRIGCENLRFSSRCSVFLILVQDDGITRFNFWLWHVLCVRRGFGRCHAEKCSSVPNPPPSECNFTAFMERLIITFPNFLSFPSIQISTLTCRSRSSMKMKGPGPRKHSQNREPSDPEQKLQYIFTTPKPQFHFSSVESASPCYKNCRYPSLLNLQGPTCHRLAVLP
jgi:hypothetical protein